VKCQSPSDERSAGDPHATFCGSRERVTAPGDPVLGVKLPGLLGSRLRGKPATRIGHLSAAEGA